MKKVAVIIILFALYTLIVCKIPIITEWDRIVISTIQEKMTNIPEWINKLNSINTYNTMLYGPIIIGGIYLFIRKLYPQIVVLAASPFIAFGFNILFKGIIQRPRPPYELQIGTHTNSFSYVSSHTIIMFCLWSMIIYYVNKNCKNKFLKYSIITFSTIWILFSGFSRIWLGVHNPTDVIGAYILGSIFVVTYIKISKAIEKRQNK